MFHDSSHSSGRLALVTGATGYVGGLLTQRLLDEGWRVRVLTRNRGGVEAQPWASAVEVLEGDAGSGEDLARVLQGVDTAYYLIHSMGQADDFEARDRAIAQSFGAAATTTGVRRIVYLSGLHPAGELSPHLASRVEVGDILLASGVPTAVIQAAVVVGNGSVSFDMLRYLAERLPVMIAPKWLNNRIQPIAVDDVLHYLVGAAELPDDINRTFDIGGPDVLTYAEMLKRFAEVTGLRRRLIVTVPVLTPHLASLWIGLVTPLDVGVAKPLIGSLVHEVVRRENDIDEHIGTPPGGPTRFDDAVRAAVADAPADYGLRNVAVAAGALFAAAVALGAALRYR